MQDQAALWLFNLVLAAGQDRPISTVRAHTVYFNMQGVITDRVKSIGLVSAAVLSEAISTCES